MRSHSVGALSIIIASWLVFLTTLFINAISANGGVALGWFKNNTGEISDVYPTEVTPSAWTFTLWGVIYFFQVGWMIYLTSTIFRRNAHGGYLYRDPNNLPWPVHVCYILANVCNITWLFLWDRQYLGACLPIIALIPFNLYLCAIFSTRSLARNLQDMITQGLKIDIWMNRFAHNAFGVYATWTSIATLINLATVLIYRSPINATIENASTGSLSILLIELCLWTFLDLVFFDKYTRYVVTPYYVVIQALAGILSKNYVPGRRNSILTVILMVVAILAAIVKILVIVYRSLRRVPPEAEAINFKRGL